MRQPNLLYVHMYAPVRLIVIQIYKTVGLQPNMEAPKAIRKIVYTHSHLGAKYKVAARHKQNVLETRFMAGSVQVTQANALFFVSNCCASEWCN